MNCSTHLRLLAQMAFAGAAASTDEHNTDLVVIDRSLLETAAEVYREICELCRPS